MKGVRWDFRSNAHSAPGRSSASCRMAGSSSFRPGSTLCHNRWPCDFADLIQSCRNRVFTTHRGRDIINQVRAIIATGIPF